MAARVLLQHSVVGAPTGVSVELEAHEHEQAIGSLLVPERAAPLLKPATDGGELVFEAACGHRMKGLGQLPDDALLVGVDPGMKPWCRAVFNLNSFVYLE